MTTILKRILAFGSKVVKWEPWLDAIGDKRPRPQIPASRVVRAIAVMFLGRSGSLNAIEQSSKRPFWHRWLRGPLPSADTLGRVAEGIDLDQVREVQHQVYSRLKRGKALPAISGRHELITAVVDGHESSASYRQCCPGCMKRTIHSEQGEGDRTQCYHRHVTLSLITRDMVVPLDLEPQHQGESEIDAARRLVQRCVRHYPRAFDVVVADGLYADSNFINEIVGHGKGCIVVLKDERRNLFQDAMGLCEQLTPRKFERRGRQCTVWDMCDLTTYPQVKHPVRVVRSVEEWSVKRQLDGKPEKMQSEWTWAVVMPPHRQQPTAQTIVEMGHGRWGIENQTFNELSTRWHVDHIYRHQPQAILVFTLLGMICLTVFQAFYRRNLKPEYRRRHTMKHIANLIRAQLLTDDTPRSPRAPGTLSLPP